jgi:hypothetical protein
MDELKRMLVARLTRSPASFDPAEVGGLLQRWLLLEGAHPEFFGYGAYFEGELANAAGHHLEASLAFERCGRTAAAAASIAGAPLTEVCRMRYGNLLDLLGRREEALRAYRAVDAAPLVERIKAWTHTPFVLPAVR